MNKTIKSRKMLSHVVTKTSWRSEASRDVSGSVASLEMAPRSAAGSDQYRTLCWGTGCQLSDLNYLNYWIQFTWSLYNSNPITYTFLMYFMCFNIYNNYVIVYIDWLFIFGGYIPISARAYWHLSCYTVVPRVQVTVFTVYVIGFR